MRNDSIIDAKNTGAALRKKRLELGMTVRETAEIVKVSPTTVYGWEYGRKIPSIGHLAVLSAYYGCHIDDLVVTYF